MNIYYVYIYKDPDTLLPFYVGKGKNNRYKDHLGYATNSDLSNHKLNRIRKILNTGKIPVIDFYVCDVSEETAFAVEMALIRIYGRCDNGTGILTNLTDGGKGISEHTEETRRKMSITRKGVAKSVGMVDKMRRTKTGKSKPSGRNTNSDPVAITNLQNRIKNFYFNTLKELSDHIIVLSNSGMSNVKISEHLNISQTSVAKYKKMVFKSW